MEIDSCSLAPLSASILIANRAVLDVEFWDFASWGEPELSFGFFWKVVTNFFFQGFEFDRTISVLIVVNLEGDSPRVVAHLEKRKVVKYTWEVFFDEIMPYFFKYFKVCLATVLVIF